MCLGILLRVLTVVTVVGVVANVIGSFVDVLVPRDLLRLQNNGWTDTCEHRLSIPSRVPYMVNPDVVGTCETNFVVIYFPENYRDRKILTAECDPQCTGKSCYGSVKGSSYYKCENEIREIAVTGPAGNRQLFNISVGCLCGKVPSSDGNPRFNVVGSN